MLSGLDFWKKYIGLTDVAETPKDAQKLPDLLEAMRKEKMTNEDKPVKLPEPKKTTKD